MVNSTQSSGWLVAVGNLQKSPQSIKAEKTNPCDYCGADFTSPANVTSKKYCSPRCQRDARHLREHGRRPVPKKARAE